MELTVDLRRVDDRNMEGQKNTTQMGFDGNFDKSDDSILSSELRPELVVAEERESGPIRLEVQGTQQTSGGTVVERSCTEISAQ